MSIFDIPPDMDEDMYYGTCMTHVDYSNLPPAAAAQIDEGLSMQQPTKRELALAKHGWVLIENDHVKKTLD